MVIIWSVLALVVTNGWNMFQIDVNNGFLQDDLDEEVYMDIPQVYVDKRSTESGGSSGKKVCRLLK